MNKTITISEDDLMEAEANVLTEMVLKTPEIALISGVLTTFRAGNGSSAAGYRKFNKWNAGCK